MVRIISSLSSNMAVAVGFRYPESKMASVWEANSSRNSVRSSCSCNCSYKNTYIVSLRYIQLISLAQAHNETEWIINPFLFSFVSSATLHNVSSVGME